MLPFADGVIVITHWKVNNNEVKLDRYKPTLYQEHLKKMTQFDKVYALELVGVQNDDKMSPECPLRLDKSRVDKNRLEENRVETEIKISVPPQKTTIKQIILESSGEIPSEYHPIFDEFINHWSEVFVR